MTALLRLRLLLSTDLAMPIRQHGAPLAGDVGASSAENADFIVCKILDLRFHALPDEITACHSSLGGEFGEWIDVVKDARSARAGAAGAGDPPQHPIHL